MSISAIGSTIQTDAYTKTQDVATTVKENEQATSTQAAATTTSQQTTSTAQQANESNPQVVEQNSAAIYEKSGETVAKKQNVDPNEVSRLLKESQAQTQQFQKLLESLLTKQADKNALANGTNRGTELNTLANGLFNGDQVMVEVDEATRLKAQEDISEDGYFGVKKTSERILSFADALSGGDPKKLEEMRTAAMKGFDEAEKMWGGKLPQISQDTREAVNKGFDDLAKKYAGV